MEWVNRGYFEEKFSNLRWSDGNSVLFERSSVSEDFPAVTEDSQIRRFAGTFMHYFLVDTGYVRHFFDRYWHGTSRCWLMGFIFFCRYCLCLICPANILLMLAWPWHVAELASFPLGCHFSLLKKKREASFFLFSFPWRSFFLRWFIF